MANLLEGFDTTDIPTPAPKTLRTDRSGDRRKYRALSPVAGPVQKRRKPNGVLPPSRPAAPDFDSDDGFLPPNDFEGPEGSQDIAMSDPPASSPAARKAERKAQVKQEPDNDDDDDLMEVAHAGAVNSAAINITGSRPIKKPLEKNPYPSPASSSPVKPSLDASVDSTPWNDLTEKLNVISDPTETRPIGKIDHTDAVEADGSLNFFWTDYIEVNGSLCLFGKVLNRKSNTYVSCFVKIDNILRKLYFLPRQQRFRNGRPTDETVGMTNVYEEVDELMTNMRVDMFKIKACTRKYAFELPDVPKEAQYMKLLYPYTSKPFSWS